MTAQKIYMTNSCNDCRELTEERVISMMKEYAEIKCKQQRVLCSKVLPNKSIAYYLVLDTELPRFD